MTELTPKQVFHLNEDVKRELTVVTTSDNFHLALCFGLAEYVTRRTPNSDQLAAVRDFIGIFLNLPSKDEPLPVFPVRTLDHSVLQPVRPTATIPAK